MSKLHRLAPCALAAMLVAAPGQGQEYLLHAFGDSITEGYGDTVGPGGGYPRRLQQWLGGYGYDATVLNHGVGGETTGEGLSRIDDVLASGGDFLLLMEGTNDISRHVGIETIRFNLDEMAGRAEALGMRALHATVIPRIPEAPTDGNNARTSALAASLLELGELRNRAVVDNFGLFESLPDVFENYYYYDPDVPDPVGHPNSDGYQQIAGLFLETLLPILESPIVSILRPATITAGSPAHFDLTGNATFVQSEWTFGDGGWAAGDTATGLGADYLFLTPGTYTVALRARTAEGGFAETQVQVTVTGSTPAWEIAVGEFPAFYDSIDDGLETQLELFNAGLPPAIVELELLAEISYDETLGPRRFYLAGESDLLLPQAHYAFGLPAARGALRVTFYALPAGTTGDLGAFALIHPAGAAGGSGGAVVPVHRDENWTATAQQLPSLSLAAGDTSALAVANLDADSASVRLDLYDAADAHIGSAIFDLAPGATRLRALDDIVRDVDERNQPLRAVFSAASNRYSAAALKLDADGNQVTYQLATP